MNLLMCLSSFTNAGNMPIRIRHHTYDPDITPSLGNLWPFAGNVRGMKGLGRWPGCKIHSGSRILLDDRNQNNEGKGNHTRETQHSHCES